MSRNAKIIRSLLSFPTQSNAQGDATKVSFTLYGERSARCSSWIQKKKRHLRSNHKHSLHTRVLHTISEG